MKLLWTTFLILSVLFAEFAGALPAADKKGGGKKGGKKDEPKKATGGLPALQKDIGMVSQALANTNNTLVKFKGGSIKGLVGLLAVNEGVNQLQESIQATQADAEKTQRLNLNQSTILGTQFLGVQPQIGSLVDNLIVKKPQFDKAGFKILDVRSLIRDSVQGQADSTTGLGMALVNVLDPSLATLAQPVLADIQKNFTAVSDAFQGRGGKIKIPADAVPQLSGLLSDVARALGIRAGDKSVALAAADIDNVMFAADGAMPLSQEAVDKAVPRVMYNNFAEAADGIQGADTPDAAAAADESAASISDSELDRLGENENDLRGVPPLVRGVLRRYGII